MPTTKAMPTFHTASAAVTKVTKRSPLSLLKSHDAERELSAGEEQDHAQDARRKQPQQRADRAAEEHRRDKQQRRRG